MRYLAGFAFAIALAFFSVPEALGQASCIELANCAMTANPLDWLLLPLQQTFGDWMYIIIWGIIIGPLYMRSGHPLMVAVIGVFLMIGLLSTTTIATTLSDAVFYGFLLVIPAFGLVGYSVYKRANQP